MRSKFLLDTNIVVFRVSNRKKLSRDQLRVLDQADALRPILIEPADCIIAANVVSTIE